jgi:hypothetical protein
VGNYRTPIRTYYHCQVCGSRPVDQTGRRFDGLVLGRSQWPPRNLAHKIADRSPDLRTEQTWQSIESPRSERKSTASVASLLFRLKLCRSTETSVKSTANFVTSQRWSFLAALPLAHAITKTYKMTSGQSSRRDSQVLSFGVVMRSMLIKQVHWTGQLSLLITRMNAQPLDG